MLFWARTNLVFGRQLYLWEYVCACACLSVCVQECICLCLCLCLCLCVCLSLCGFVLVALCAFKNGVLSALKIYQGWKWLHRMMPIFDSWTSLSSLIPSTRSTSFHELTTVSRALTTSFGQCSKNLMQITKAAVLVLIKSNFAPK